MKIRLSLSSAIVAFGIVLAIGFTAVVSTSLYALRELKVGGPLYSDIKLGNDLIADILPPPEYVIEAYLEATLAMREPDQLAAHGERLIQLRKDYDERKAFWVTSSLSADLKTELVSKSDAEVQKFWKASDQLLPALKAMDAAASERIYAQLKISCKPRLLIGVRMYRTGKFIAFYAKVFFKDQAVTKLQTFLVQLHRYFALGYNDLVGAGL